MEKSTYGWHKMAKGGTALGELQRSTAKAEGQRRKESLTEGNFGIERSYRKRLAKDMKHSAKSDALKRKMNSTMEKNK